MSTEKLVKQVAYLRKAGGYSLTVTKEEGTYLAVGFFKDIGSYGTTVSFAAQDDNLEVAQAGCIEGLATLVKYTEDSKPTKPEAVNKAYNSYSAPTPTGNGSIVSLKGLKDNQFQQAKEIIKQAGYRFDAASKDWIGGDASQLPDWLGKRVKGSASNGYKKAYTPAAKPAPVEQEPEQEEDIPFGPQDEMPW